MRLGWVRRVASLGFCIAFLSALLVVPPASAGPPPTPDPLCGKTVKKDFKLKHDILDCPADGLIAAASEIIINLNGFTLGGEGDGAGVNVGSKKRVKVKNGVIAGFNVGVALNTAKSARLVDLEVQDNAASGIAIGGTGNKLTRVDSHANGQDGVVISSGEGHAVTDSVFADNLGTGMSIGDVGVAVNGNESFHNEDDGISAPDVTSVTGAGNTADQNIGTNCDPARLCDGEEGDPRDDDEDGYSPPSDDCDDDDPDRNIGETEIFDDVDQDCDGAVDDGVSAEPFQLVKMVNQPTGAEYFVVYNPNPVALLVDRLWIADNNAYAGLPCSTGAPAPGDFRVRFPNGTLIGANGSLSVAPGTAVDFNTNHGVSPNFSIADGEMVGEGTVGAALTNSDEMLMLFSWDNSSDLVYDHDYLLWGDASDATDKTGTSCNMSAYLADTAAASQSFIDDPSALQAVVRCDHNEGTETKMSGNGVTGHNETSENLASTWSLTSDRNPSNFGSSLCL